MKTISKIINDWWKKRIWEKSDAPEDLQKELKREINKVIDNLDFWTFFVPEKDEERDVIDKDELKEKLGLC